MKRSIVLLALALTVLLLGFTTPAPAQSSPAKGTVIIPESSIAQPGDEGVRAHTNVLVFLPDVVEPDTSYPPGENPGSLACVYKLVKQTKGCEKGNSNFPTGGSNAIALVDAYDNPDASSDLKTFAKMFFPSVTPNFTQVYASSGPPGSGCNGKGSQPPGDEGWGLEEDLDIEYAFGMAPKAHIYLVEAQSSSDSDLFCAETVASALVAAAGGGEVSNSWISYGEDSGETEYDQYFQQTGVVFFAGSGDDGAGTGYPMVSPYVVSAGGTQINRDSNGNFTSESGWSGAGGGPSQYEKRPTWQNVIKKIVGNHRGTPDLSSDASPGSAVAIYDSYGYSGWTEVGGTSVASPTLAGIINAAGTFNSSTTKENTEMYGKYPKEYKVEFRDITTGGNSYGCKKYWDYCSGIGSPLTYVGK
jgi:subtilase family serine protease